MAELERRKPLKSANETNNFGDFSELHFGKTLQSAFIRPYNEKVWTIRLEEMNCRWAEDRVPKIDLDLLRKRCKSPLNDESQQEEHSFRFLIVFLIYAFYVSLIFTCLGIRQIVMELESCGNA